MALDIDWKNPRQFPRKRRPTRDVEALARKKAKRNHPKRHAVAKEIALAAKAKAAKRKADKQDRERRARNIKNQIAAFWRGERDEHP